MNNQSLEFELQRSSWWYIDEDDQPHEDAYIHSWHEPSHPDDPRRVPVWAIEFDSLDELMEFVGTVGENVIIHAEDATMDTERRAMTDDLRVLEIYDSWVE